MPRVAAAANHQAEQGEQDGRRDDEGEQEGQVHAPVAHLVQLGPGELLDAGPQKVDELGPFDQHRRPWPPPRAILADGAAFGARTSRSETPYRRPLDGLGVLVPRPGQNAFQAVVALVAGVLEQRPVGSPARGNSAVHGRVNECGSSTVNSYRTVSGSTPPQPLDEAGVGRRAAEGGLAHEVPRLDDEHVPFPARARVAHPLAQVAVPAAVGRNDPRVGGSSRCR